MRALIKRVLALAIVSTFAFGCAAPLEDIFWPAPPDEPRIKFIKNYYSGKDLTGSSLATELVLGASNPFRLKKPQGVHSATGEKFYVTDTAMGDVIIFDVENKDVTSLKKLKVRSIYKPIDVATDATGRIFVSDSQSDMVFVLDAESKFLGKLEPKTPFKQPTGLALDEALKRIYVVDTHSHHVEMFDLETLEHLKTIGRRGRDEGEFNYPSNVAVNSRGDLYVVDTMNGRVQSFDKNGRFNLSFGEFGDVPGMFARPKGIAIDSEDHIYVVDSAFNNVQIFNDEGQILMDFSQYGSGRGALILPSGISIDSDDFIYVADSWNARVAVYEFLGDKHKEREEKGEEGTHSK